MSQHAMERTTQARKCHNTPWRGPHRPENVATRHGDDHTGQKMSQHAMEMTTQARKCHNTPWRGPHRPENVALLSDALWHVWGPVPPSMLKMLIESASCLKRGFQPTQRTQRIDEMTQAPANRNRAVLFPAELKLLRFEI